MARRTEKAQYTEFCHHVDTSKISLRSDAQGYGRTMAVLGQGLDDMVNQVEESLHSVVRAAYAQKLAKLGVAA